MNNTDSRITAIAQAGQLFNTIIYDSLELGNRSRSIGFENPATNKKTMYLENVSGGIEIIPAETPSDYQATLTVEIAEASFTRGVTLLTPVNRNLGSPNTSTLIVSYNPVLTAVTTPKELSFTRYPTGEFSLSFGGQIIVPPGHNLYIQISSSIFGARGHLQTTFTWYESGDEQGDGTNVIPGQQGDGTDVII